MARKTKKMNTGIPLPILKPRESGIQVVSASTSEGEELNAILASVFRIFAARGRALREAREKLHADGK